jgi:hypothetical protein
MENKMTEQKRRVISSSLGSIPLTERKTIVVDDPTENVEEEIDYREVQRIKEEQKRERINSVALSKLEFLLGISRKVVDVKVEGVVFTLKTLKNKEKQNIVLEAAKQESVLLQSFNVKDLTVAYSLFKINDELIDNIIGSEINNKMEFIREMDSNLVEKLWDEYIKLNKDDNPDALGVNADEVRDTIKK